MSSAVQVAAFNNLLVELLEFLHVKFPQDHNTHLAISQVKTAMGLSPREPCLHFIQAVMPFQDEILTQNEQFFLSLLNDPEYDDCLKGFNLGDKWNTLTDEDKTYLWSSVKKLLVLGKRILAL